MNNNFNSKYENAVEEFIFNNLDLKLMPSDISAFTNNAVEEYTFMRSKSVFSLRSKYANGKIFLTFPININPFNKDPEAIESRTQGFKILTQANGYPYVFIKSKRLYSYISDKAKKSSTGYMMFAVDELKVHQYIDVQDVLFFEIALVYSDHTSQTADFRFLDDPISSQTFEHLYQSSIFNGFADALYKKKNTIFESFKTLEDYMATHKVLNGNDLPLSKALIFSPQVISQADPEAAALRAASDDPEELFKEIKITSQVGDTFLTAALMQESNENPEPEDTVSQEFSLDYLYVIHRAFHDIELGGDANIQRITCSRKNKLASQFIGSHQNPFVQYMGRYPGRVEMELIFNNKEIYKHNMESSIAALNSMSSVLSYNNSQYPEVSAYNTLKIKSLATSALGILNIVPNQTSISASSDSRNMESLIISFVESDMEEFLKVGNVVHGRELAIVNDKKIKVITSYLESFLHSKSDTQPEKQTLSTIDNPELAKEVLKSLYTSYLPMRSEILAGTDIEEDYALTQRQALKSLDDFPSVINAKFVSTLLSAIRTRTSLIKNNKNNKEELKDEEGNTLNPETGSSEGTIDARDTFSQSGIVDNIFNAAFYQLSNLSEKGDERANKVLSTVSLDDISTTINQQMLNYTGTNIEDINLDLVGNESELYLKNLQPFFFLQNVPYYTQEDLTSAVSIGSEAIQGLMDSIVNKSITDKTEESNSGVSGLRSITDEREMNEEGHDFVGGNGGGGVQVGAPGASMGAYASGKIPDWVRGRYSAQQEEVRELIKQIGEPYSKQIGSHPNFINLMIQIAGLESRLGLALVSSSGLHHGVFQLGADYIETVMKVSKSQARELWRRCKTDHRLNIEITMKGMMMHKNAMIRDGFYVWGNFYLYHQQGGRGGKTIAKAYKEGTGVTGDIRKNLSSNKMTAFGFPWSGAGDAKDVRSYVDGIYAYMGVGTEGAKPATPTRVEKPKGAVIGNAGIKFPNDELARNTVPAVVSEVEDGDTIKVILNGKTEKDSISIRFADIDAPETGKNATLYNITKVVDGKEYTFPTLKFKTTGQAGGEESKQALISSGVKVGATILIDKTRTKDAYGNRDVSNIYTLDGNHINYAMVQSGWAYATNSRGSLAVIGTQAKATRKGMFGRYKPEELINPAEYRKMQEKEKEASLLEDARRQIKAKNKDESEDKEKPKEDTVKDREAAQARSTTNNFRPFLGVNPKISSGFGPRSTSKATSGSSNHKGLDFPLPNGTPIIAAANGVVTRVSYQRPTNKATFGKYIRIDHQNGFYSVYADLSVFKVKQGDKVSYKQVIGYSGNTGSKDSSRNFHLHYEVRYGNNNPVHPLYTTPLNEVPPGSNPLDYIDVDFKKGNYSSKELGTEKLNVGGISGALNTILTGYEGAFNSSEDIERDAKSDPTSSRGIESQYSVYNENNQIELQTRNMAYKQQYGVNTAFPVIKAYITVGNENEDLVIGAFVKLDQFFEITGLEDFELACNNDDNPVDVLKLTIANPSFIRLDNYSLMGHFLTTDYNKIGTNLESQFIGDRLTVRPGMKLHLRVGYGNDPNHLKTIFNGSISEISTENHYTLSVMCEGFGKELVSYYHSPLKPTKAGGVLTNSSTPLVIGGALQADSIAHFGWRASFWKAAIGTSINALDFIPAVALGKTLYKFFGYLADKFQGKEANTGSEEASQIEDSINGAGITGDYLPDPESKRLTRSISADSLKGFRFAYSNYRQRLYTNIYAAEISHVHAEYNSNYWTYFKNLFDWTGTWQSGYHYLFYNTTPWQAVKEMEYRNPGTFAKPLIYEDRMTMFYGIKEQLYIARDLDPVFMALSGAKTGTISNTYLQQRPKRFDLVSAFHILSTNTNIITNTMGLNGKYATSVNVLYFEDAGDFGNDGSDDFTMDIDDDIVSWEIRQKTINYNGIHGKYSAWMYGTQELKRESEKMYGGQITITGTPSMKAGDYCYIQDDLRKISGIVKVRECFHYMNSNSGYTTVIVPGQYVEAKSFVYSMLFMKLGFAAKLVLAQSELSMKYTENGDAIFQDYLDSLTIISKWSEDKPFFQNLVDNGSIASVGFASFTGLLLLATSYFSKTTGYSALARVGLSTAIGSARAAGTISLQTISILSELKYGSAWRLFKNSANEKMKALKNIPKATAKKNIIIRMAATVVKLPVSLTTGTLKMGSALAIATTFRAARALSTVAAIATAAFMSNPIGWILSLAGSVLLSYVMMKIEEATLTREPLLLFPVILSGRPYQAGIRGYQRNTWIEAKKNAWNRNMKEVSKAANYIEIASTNSIQKSVAGFLSDHTVNKKILEESAERVSRQKAKEIKEEK